VEDAAVLCPSSRCEPGAILVGVILPSGKLAYASDELIIDQLFVDAAREGRAAEKRFRFSSPCVRAACRQWTGSRCGVIDEVRDALGNPAPTELPACSIRGRCRWFAQAGAAACAVCPQVITDARRDVPDSASG